MTRSQSARSTPPGWSMKMRSDSPPGRPTATRRTQTYGRRQQGLFHGLLGLYAVRLRRTTVPHYRFEVRRRRDDRGAATRTASRPRSASSTCTWSARAAHERLWDGSARTRSTVDGVAGRGVRGVGADRARASRGGRLQRLGRRRPPDAPDWRLAASGSSSCPSAADGDRYKFEPCTARRRSYLKADPLGARTEVPPRDRLGRAPRWTYVWATTTGWRAAPPATSVTRRWRSTRCTSARGAAEAARR